MLSTNENAYNTPKDFFIYLLSIITLYLFFTSIIVLLFKYVDIIYPSQVDLYSSHLQSIRWYIAITIITFPVYLYTLVSIRKDYLRYPEKRNLKIRKWLLYFTLFIAAIIVMSDLGTLLYYFLGGDITARFLLKTSIIFVLVSLLFIFYLRELHRGWHANQTLMWLMAVLLLVAATLGFGFYLIGSPAKARQAWFDQKRVSDLAAIQNAIIDYQTKKKQLPNSLQALTNPITGFKVPNDPVTKNTYVYRLLTPNRFELCATFTQPSKDAHRYSALPLSDQNWNWAHPAGYYCFQRTLDR